MGQKKVTKVRLLTLSSAVLASLMLHSQTIHAMEGTETSQPVETVVALDTDAMADNVPVTPEVSGNTSTLSVSDSTTDNGLTELTETPETEAPKAEMTEATTVASTPTEAKLTTVEPVTEPTKVEATTVAPTEVESAETDATEITVETLSTEKEPLSTESNAIVNVQPLWQSNMKGQGTVVAVIDSGLDISHDVLTMKDMTNAKYKNAAEMEQAMKDAGIEYGKWYSDKVIFGYNYADTNDELKEKEADSHGMHVSGIAVGNPTQPHSSGDYIYGVAPEAQLMFMRVFSDTGRGTSPFLYARAIEDAIKLGADTINLSLGSSNGVLNDTSKVIEAAINKANAAGITVVIAGGNDGAFGEGHAKPDADKPDYGLVGDPAVARESIAVASFNNTHVMNEVLTIAGADKQDVVYSRPSMETAPFDATKAYEYVYVGKGKDTDFENIGDLSGKIALIERGDIAFTAKIQNAKKHNADGVIIFNNGDGDAHSVTMSITEAETSMPSVFIDRASGLSLVERANTGVTISIGEGFKLYDNPQANQLSDFSSWGLSADGELKPDLAAPGGAIFSSINDNRYANMNGTSMAAPHVAGLSALMTQALSERFPELKGKELALLIKHLLMSTAVTHVNTETNAFTSPRQQGAGIANVSKAVTSDLYLTGDEGLSSITLGNVDETFTFNVTVHNLSNEEKVVKYVTDVNTDQVENGKVTLRPRKLTEFDGGAITVAANGSVTVPISVNTAQFTQELTELMVNGYYLEGFVRFLDTVDNTELVSIPYVGFKGKFQDLAIIEKPVYDFKDGEKTFYVDLSKVTSFTQEENSHYTALMIGEKDFDHLENTYTDTVGLTAGAFKDAEGNYVLRRDAQDKPIIAISPNGDGNRDAIAFRGMFLRNYQGLRAAVYKADDTAFANPVWVGESTAGDKNHFSANPSNPKSTIIDESEWSGKDSEGNVVADGAYKYVIEHYSNVPGSAMQRLVFDVVVDTAAPVALTGVYDEATRQFKPRETKEEGVGVYREQMYYVLDKFVFEGETIDDSEWIKDPTRKEYIEKNPDGTYTLPAEDLYGRPLSEENIWYVTEDFAGNTVRTTLADYKRIGNASGVATIELMDHELEMSLDMLGYRYDIKDATGKSVTAETKVDKGLHILPFGEYTVELMLFDEEYAQLLDTEKIKKIVVDENNTEHSVQFAAKLVLYSTLTVDFDTELPQGMHVYAVDENGKRTTLTKGRYITDVFEKTLPYNQTYTIVVETPAGYFVSGENMTADMAEDHVVKLFSLWAKGELAAGGTALSQSEKAEIDVTLDADGDGFTTEEELKGNSNPFDATSVPEVFETSMPETAPEKPAVDLMSDADGDGFTTEEELKGNSNPFDATSVPFVWKKVEALLLPVLPTLSESLLAPRVVTLSATVTEEPKAETVETASASKEQSESKLETTEKGKHQAVATAKTPVNAGEKRLPKTGEASMLLSALYGMVMLTVAYVCTRKQSQK